jgi:hypothetical protein
MVICARLSSKGHSHPQKSHGRDDDKPRGKRDDAPGQAGDKPRGKSDDAPGRNQDKPRGTHGR